METNDLVKEFEKAQSIINGYGGVLESAFSMPYGAPESLLPFTKDEIKRAIKLAALILTKVEPTAEATVQQLKVCYVQLASFIPDEEASIAAKAQDALDSGDPSRITSAETQQALDRVEQISQESQALSSEFETYMQEIT